ncbi:uncharacterized protein [Littorina saxatilis]|uniref:BHLH domain-containing protein n=1 Tax=Littorina saxatilis TaxID=31220 RepID=A0AAN9BKN9_9CAEN
MEFSPTMMERVSREMLQSPYHSRQSDPSPVKNCGGYDSLDTLSPASGYYSHHRHHHLQHRHHQQQHQQQQQRRLQQREEIQRELERRAERVMASPQATESPKRQFSSFISCMFAASPTSSAASPAPTSPLMLSSPSSVSSSPYYPQSHHRLGNNAMPSATKREMRLKENDPLSPHIYSRSPSSSHFPASLSPGKTLTPSHCKRRLDFNHNPVSDHDGDLDHNFNISYATAATTTIDEMALGFYPRDLSPRLPLSQGGGDEGAAGLGRVPAVAVARRNERERNRVKLINTTFATLRDHLPHGGGARATSKNRKMSKVETLRAAIEYIRKLHTLIKERQAASGITTKDGDNNPFHPLIKVESMELESACLHEIAASAASSSLALSSSASLILSSPQSSAGGGGRSPGGSDDACSTYDHLSTEEEDLLEFASNWF